MVIFSSLNLNLELAQPECAAGKCITTLANLHSR